MRHLLLVLVVILLSQSAKSQVIKHQFQFRAEAAIPVTDNDYNVGWGLQFKWLRRLAIGQFTVSAGYTKVSNGDFSGDGKGASLHMVPLLAGYRVNINKLYVEAQVGYGSLGGRFDIGGDYSKPSNGAFFYGIDAGYNLNRLEIGAHYLAAKSTGSDGVWHDKSFGYAGIYVALNLKKNK